MHIAVAIWLEMIRRSLGQRVAGNPTPCLIWASQYKKLCQFTPTLEHFKIKATRALYALRAKININSLPKVALKLFDAIIKPILLYGSEVWEPFLNQDGKKWDENFVEKTYTQFLKQILGVKVCIQCHGKRRAESTQSPSRNPKTKHQLCRIYPK